MVSKYLECLRSSVQTLVKSRAEHGNWSHFPEKEVRLQLGWRGGRRDGTRAASPVVYLGTFLSRKQNNQVYGFVVKTVQSPGTQPTSREQRLQCGVFPCPVWSPGKKETGLTISEKNGYSSLFPCLLSHCLEREVSPNSYLSYVSSLRH